MFPFLAISLVKHFYIPQFLHSPQSRGQCLFSRLSHYAISKVHFVANPHVEPCATSSVLPWTLSRVLRLRLSSCGVLCLLDLDEAASVT